MILTEQPTDERDATEAEARQIIEWLKELPFREYTLLPARRAAFIESIPTARDEADAAYGQLDISSWAAKYPCVPVTYKPVAECDHAGEYPIIGGMFCGDCGRKREPNGTFEKTLVSRLTPRWGYSIG